MTNVLRRFLLVLGCIAYVCLLMWAYIFIISPNYSYMGYTYVHPPTIELGLAVTIALVPVLWMPVVLQRPSQVVYWLLYLLVFIPTCFVPLYTIRSEFNGTLILPLILLICFILLGLQYKLPLVRFPRLKLSNRTSGILLLILACTALYVVFRTFGFTKQLPGILDVYEVRSSYSCKITQSNRITSYIVTWLGNAINPFMLARGLTTRNASLVFLAGFGQVVIYSITGFKTVLLSFLLIAGILLTTKLNGRLFGVLIVWGTVLLVIMSLLLDIGFKTVVFSSLFIRRLIITPGLLTGYYIQFFSANPKVLLGHSIFKHFVKYPYDLSPPNLIGSYYFGNAGTSANANLWADAFANFGYPGVFCFTMFLGIVLWLYDSVTDNDDRFSAAAMIGIPAFSLTNSALFTTLLTHGLGLLLILVYLMPRSVDKHVVDVKHRVSKGGIWTVRKP